MSSQTTHVCSTTVTMTRNTMCAGMGMLEICPPPNICLPIADICPGPSPKITLTMGRMSAIFVFGGQVSGSQMSEGANVHSFGE